MPEASLWTPRLTDDQTKRLAEICENLLNTISSIALAHKPPNQAVFRSFCADLLLACIGELAKGYLKAAVDADLKLARKLGLEPSP